MEMKIVIMGLGAKLPKIDLGVNLFTGVYLVLRANSKANQYIFGVTATPEISGLNGTLVGSYISTTWTNIDNAKYAWLCNRHNLTGKTAEVEIKGTVLISGKIDVTFKIFDNSGDSQFSFERVEVKSEGFQLSSTKIRGVVQNLMPKKSLDEQYCG